MQQQRIPAVGYMEGPGRVDGGFEILGVGSGLHAGWESALPRSVGPAASRILNTDNTGWA